MLNRTYRTLSANTNRLNLGTRSLATLAGGNTGAMTLRFRSYSSVSHAYMSKRNEVMRKFDPFILIQGEQQGAWLASVAPPSGSGNAPACRWARVGKSVVGEHPPVEREVVRDDRARPDRRPSTASLPGRVRRAA